ncbi:YhdP family protein [Methylobacterium sp. ID0610]|uniref:YhdP family protein n=1 Tax=Methylobacterium carpenticola TaxID=3344827 RepID=UPI0036C0F257
MDQAAHPDPAPLPAAPSPAQRRSVVRRCVRGVLLLKLAVALLLGLGCGLAYLRLSSGPMSFTWLEPRLAAAIAGRLGPGWSVDLRDSAIEIDRDGALALRTTGLDIRNPEGVLVVRAPLALVSIDLLPLLSLSIQPRSVEFRDLQLHAVVHRDGSIAAAADPTGAPPPTPPVVDAARGTVSPLSATVASILSLVLDPAGVIGSLDRARLTNARLTLTDDSGAERAVFPRVDGLFTRDAVRDAKVFEMRIMGPHGPWRFGGDIEQAKDQLRRGVLTLDDLPVTDLLLLSGQSRLPLTTDVKLSGRATVAMHGARLDTMTLALKSSEGTFLIEEKDFNPVTIESVSVDANWDEARRTLKLDSLDYRGAGNAVRLAGEWAASGAGADTAWRATLTGRDAVLRGAVEGDAPVRLDTLEASLAGRDDGIVIERFALAGPTASGTITGTIGTRADEGGLTLRIQADRAEGRTALRLWPEHIAPPIRTYLVDNLRGGRLDSLDITVDMTQAEFAAATRGDPMPDGAVRIAFAVSGGGLTISPDAPPLSRGRVSGLVTGRNTTIRGATAEIRMADGRVLSLQDGSFVIKDAVPHAVTAQIGLRLTGGTDALAALLQAKLFRGLTGAEIDPATVRGQTDLRIDFPLSLEAVPDIADLPVVMSGSLTDVAVDRLVGKDRLENGRFTLAYDRSGFAMKGEARLSGAPMNVDLHQPKAGVPGEAVVALVLDDAARARRGLPTAPALAGPVPARFVVPVGRPGKTTAKVEVDLARAAIDGLVPGWTKAAGKPGRLTFALTETGAGTELRDLALDAGPVSARGSAVISAEGGLERAEFTSLKLSPGDDVRGQVERSGGVYKLALKGGVADARPFLRALTAAPKKGAKEAAQKDVDADLNFAILTGFNDEALTSATLRLSLRGDDLRQARIQGRLRGASVRVEVNRAERSTTPVLTAESTDAGAVLRFLDIYRRMQGGRLALHTTMNDGPQTGAVQIRSFTLRDEPALGRIMAQGEPAPEDRGGRSPGRRQETNDVGFDRLSAEFVRTGTRVDFSDAAISGPAMGFTLGGWLDTGRNATDIRGTFVPLYGLNNVFSQVPIVGPLLGGGHNEGLFGINFSVTGSMSAPNVAVNPLSAIAPGFLRKLFGAGGDPSATASPRLNP